VQLSAIPAKAGIQRVRYKTERIPAFPGMTEKSCISRDLSVNDFAVLNLSRKQWEQNIMFAFVQFDIAKNPRIDKSFFKKRFHGFFA
jgi:hypothetical protein